MTSRSRTTILTALLALALLVPASAQAAIERTVSVTAEATLKVPNDSASLGFSVSRERRTRGAALRAVAGGLRGVIAAVQATPGVGPGDVTTGRISVRKSFRGERPVYRAGEGIGVTLHQPDKAGELVSAAIGAGATGVSGPSFFVGDTEAAFANALAAAFDKAKLRATALATRAGGDARPGADDRRRRRRRADAPVRGQAAKSARGATCEPREPRRRRRSRSSDQQALHHRPAADQARHLDGDRNGPRRLRPAVGEAPRPARVASRAAGRGRAAPAAYSAGILAGRLAGAAGERAARCRWISRWSWSPATTVRCSCSTVRRRSPKRARCRRSKSRRPLPSASSRHAAARSGTAASATASSAAASSAAGRGRTASRSSPGGRGRGLVASPWTPPRVDRRLQRRGAARVRLGGARLPHRLRHLPGREARPQHAGPPDRRAARPGPRRRGARRGRLADRRSMAASASAGCAVLSSAARRWRVGEALLVEPRPA